MLGARLVVLHRAITVSTKTTKIPPTPPTLCLSNEKNQDIALTTKTFALKLCLSYIFVLVSQGQIDLEYTQSI